ncbi:MAG TPA: STAS domain-containing protein [Burkholderiales bacterium]|jgi:phospholipid transport system transporter-binding protein|nr:STAS domain-containing protein [Burkholderiales bacterium]
MIRREGERLIVSGPVTVANVAALLEEARAPLAEGARRIDLGEVTELDSSLLALLLAWMREARARGGSLTFTRLPPELSTLAQLYGVAELLPHDAPR